MLYLFIGICINNLGLAAGQAARATEQRKHDEDDTKCKELGRPHGG